MSTPLVGSVLERPTSFSASSSLSVQPAGPGFPVAQHRSKSTFARNREQHQASSSNLRTVQSLESTVAPQAYTSESMPIVDDDWRAQISRENAARVEQMSQETIELERHDIIARFGPDVSEILKKARVARERLGPADTVNPGVQNRRSEEGSKEVSYHLHNSGRFTSKTVRFAPTSRDNTTLNESTPPYPTSQALGFLAPDASIEEKDNVSLGQRTGHISPDLREEAINVDAEEGSPEYIRQRYFPSAPKFDSNLAWMSNSPSTAKSNANQPTKTSSAAIRFDLSGKLIPLALSAVLPTHLGLHHHSEGELAGYTLDDILLLCRSSMPSQRSAMIEVLSKVAKTIVDDSLSSEQLHTRSINLRNSFCAVGVEGLREKGTAAVHAIEVLWICIVLWQRSKSVPVKFNTSNEDHNADGSFMEKLPLGYILGQMSSFYAIRALPRHSLARCLEILTELAVHNDSIGTQMVETPDLMMNLTRYFVQNSSLHSDRFATDAIQLLIIEANVSRSNALILSTEIADLLLRYVITLPPRSISALVLTLDFYHVLARYGLYAQVVRIAAPNLAKLASFVASSCATATLQRAWAGLIEAWIVCATDPHQTTPDHAILWTQVVGWQWHNDIRAVQVGMSQKNVDGIADVYAACWSAETAWLEGSRVNSVKSGITAQEEAINFYKPLFEDGLYSNILINALDGMDRGMIYLAVSDDEGENRLTQLKALAHDAVIVTESLRLWVSCFTHTATNPPFRLPFAKVSSTASRLVLHPLWIEFVTSYHLRYLSSFLSVFLKLSYRLPGVPKKLWLAQCFSIICHLKPGDEMAGSALLDTAFDLLDAMILAEEEHPVQEAVRVAKLFMIFPFKIPDSTFTGPLHPTPASILSSSTQNAKLIDSGSQYHLPVTRSWSFASLTHLLRSSSSPIFPLPTAFEATEIEIVRGTLLVAIAVQSILRQHGLYHFVLTREEAVFQCMQIYMLEHGQAQESTVDTLGEVFRDELIRKLLVRLLAPYTKRSGPQSASSAKSGNLEIVASHFLGPSVPFFQYYTDFVALYDAVSFSDPTFASLLLFPTSMVYPVDYRRLIWGDYVHLLRTIHIHLEEILTDNLTEFLWPVEEDGRVLQGQLNALMQGRLTGFVHFIAIHHVASYFWKGTGGLSGSRNAKHFMHAILNHNDITLIKQVLGYVQGDRCSLKFPPDCFETGSEVVKDRLDEIDQVFGRDWKARLTAAIC